MAFLTQTMLGSLHLNPSDSPASLSSTAPVWRATYDTTSAVALEVGETKSSIILDIATDAFNNVYSAGTARYGSNSFNTLTKQDSAGQVEWQTFIPAAGSGFAYLAVDAFGSVWVLATDSRKRLGSETFEIVSSTLHKFDSLGNAVATIAIRPYMNNTYAGTARFQANGITLDPVTGDVYVYGVQYDAASFILRISNNGTLLAQYAYSQLKSNFIRSLALDSSGNMYITTMSSDISSYDNSKQPGGIVVIKLDPSGTVVWQRVVNVNLSITNSANTAVTSSLIIDAAGNLYVMGGNTTTSNFSNPALVKLSPQGAIIWTRKFSDKPATFNGGAVAMSFDESGDILVHCIVRRGFIGQTITSISPNGKFNWKKLLTAPNRDLVFTKLAFSTDGAILLPGAFTSQNVPSGLVVKINIKNSTATQFGEVTDLNIVNDAYSLVAHTPTLGASAPIVKSSSTSNPPYHYQFRLESSSPAAIFDTGTDYNVTLV